MKKISIFYLIPIAMVVFCFYKLTGIADWSWWDISYIPLVPLVFLFVFWLFFIFCKEETRIAIEKAVEKFVNERK